MKIPRHRRQPPEQRRVVDEPLRDDVNDRACTLHFTIDAKQTRAEQLAAGRGLGRRRVALDLARRGVEPAVVAAALGPEEWPEELARARDAASRWRRRGGEQPDALARHLDRKGFSRRAIVAILQELGLEAADEAGDEPAPQD